MTKLRGYSSEDKEFFDSCKYCILIVDLQGDVRHLCFYTEKPEESDYLNLAEEIKNDENPFYIDDDVTDLDFKLIFGDELVVLKSQMSIEKDNSLSINSGPVIGIIPDIPPISLN